MSRFPMACSVAFVSLFAVACSSSSAEEDDSNGGQAVVAAPSAARTGFKCECAASGPGYEDNEKGDKHCAYTCSCDVFTAAGQEKVPTFETPAMVTSAKSRETWDIGSHVCHGQYAWRPTLDAPNWQIKIKFNKFQMTSFTDDVYYPETMVEVASTVRSEVKWTTTAPEIRAALAKKLGVTVR